MTTVFTQNGHCTVVVYSWSIANNFVIDVYCRYLEILCQIAQSSIANYFGSYSLLQFGIKSMGIYSRRLYKVVSYIISNHICISSLPRRHAPMTWGQKITRQNNPVTDQWIKFALTNRWKHLEVGKDFVGLCKYDWSGK